MPVSTLSQTRSGSPGGAAASSSSCETWWTTDSRRRRRISTMSAASSMPGQHHDAVVEPAGADAQAVGDRGHAEGIGAAQGARHALEAMAVAIGLDHRHDLAAWRQLPHPDQVFAQGSDVDRRAHVATHSKDPA